MKKGDIVYFKNARATFKGPTGGGRNPKFLIQLPDGEHREVSRSAFKTEEEKEAEKEEKGVARKQKSLDRRNSPDMVEHRNSVIRDKIAELEREREEIMFEQDLEAGIDGDNFEATGKHNEYGDKLNRVDNKIMRLKAKLESQGEKIEEAKKLLSKLLGTKITLK